MKGKTMDVHAILADTLKNGGGTYNLDGSAIPHNGFVVALGRKFGAIVSDNSPIEFADMLTDIAAIGYAKTIGTWHNENRIYIDAVEIATDRNSAIELGELRNQIAIWDIANECEIETGGNGE